MSTGSCFYNIALFTDSFILGWDARAVPARLRMIYGPCRVLFGHCLSLGFFTQLLFEIYWASIGIVSFYPVLCGFGVVYNPRSSVAGSWRAVCSTKSEDGGEDTESVLSSASRPLQEQHVDHRDPDGRMATAFQESVNPWGPHPQTSVPYIYCSVVTCSCYLGC